MKLSETTHPQVARQVQQSLDGAYMESRCRIRLA